jgi:hypothetical protein
MSDVSSSVPLLLALRSLIDTAIAREQHQEAAPPAAANEREPEYLSVADFAARLGVTERAVRQMVAEGMPHVRPRPRLTRIVVAQAVAWMAARSGAAGPDVAVKAARRRATLDAHRGEVR